MSFTVGVSAIMNAVKSTGVPARSVVFLPGMLSRQGFGSLIGTGFPEVLTDYDAAAVNNLLSLLESTYKEDPKTPAEAATLMAEGYERMFSNCGWPKIAFFAYFCRLINEDIGEVALHRSLRRKQWKKIINSSNFLLTRDDRLLKKVLLIRKEEIDRGSDVRVENSKERVVTDFIHHYLPDKLWLKRAA